MDTLETNYIKIPKTFKDKDHEMRQIRYLVKLYFNTEYENVHFINGNHCDLRRENVILLK